MTTSHATSFGQIAKRVLTPPLVGLAVVLMLVEESLWHGLVRLGAWVGHWRPVAAVERRLAALPPWACLAVLLLPVALGVPVELFALWLMTSHPAGGLALLVAAKLGPTALVARLYTVCEAQLVTIGWFVRVRDGILAAKNWAHRRLEALPAWRLAHTLLAHARRWLGRRLRGAE